MEAKKGNKVTLDYEGRLESGEVFDSSKHGDHSHPLTFEIGSGQVIRGFDSGVQGMKVDEEKEIKIEAKEGYGDIDERLIQEVPKTNFPKSLDLKEGLDLMLSTPQGNVPAKVKEVKENSVVMDFNHPLAGKNLIFKVKLLKIE